MKTKFFRIDLNLQKFWWHRLLLVLFFISSIGLFGILVKRVINNIQFPRYTKVCKFSDRVDSQLRLIGDLMQPNEKYNYREEDILNHNDEEYLKKKSQRIFCAKNISFLIDEISNKTKVYKYGYNGILSKIEFAKELEKQNAQFIEVGEFGNTIALSNNWVWDEMNVYDLSIVKTIAFSLLKTLQVLLILIIYIFLIIIIYYKVIIYIIFGSYETDN